MTTRNGTAVSKFLGRPQTADYRPTTVGGNIAPLWYNGQLGHFSKTDIEVMRRDPQCGFGMRILRAPLHTVAWEIEAEDRAIAAFVDAQFKRFWLNSLEKSLRMLEWGHFGAEPLYREEGGEIHFDRLKALHPNDCTPLDLHGNLAGVQVRGVKDWLRPPRSFWVVSEPEFNPFYGQSRYAQAWEAWIEKRGRHGAVDSRRLWAVKNAFDGGIMRCPNGMTEDDQGRMRSNQDYARELIEKKENGGCLVLPIVKDPETGEYLWTYEPPKINGEFKGLIDYPGVLDKDILKGMGIPPEIVEAAETGSGWSGRSVPFLVFLASEDQIAMTSIEAFDQQVCRPLAWANYGPGQHYAIKPKSLIQVQQGGDQNAQGGPPKPGQPPAQQPGSGQPYQGAPRGHGARDPNTGKINYGASLSLESARYGPEAIQRAAAALVQATAPLKLADISAEVARLLDARR